MQHSLAEPFENEVPAIIPEIPKMHMWVKIGLNFNPTFPCDVIFSSHIPGV